MNHTLGLPNTGPAVLLLAALTGTAISCGSNTGGGGGSGGGTSSSSASSSTSSSSSTSTSTSSSSTSTSTSSSSSGAGTCDPQCQGGLTCAVDSEFCAADAAPVDCNLASSNDTVQVCGVPLGDPGADLTRSAGVKEFAGSGPPSLDCYAPGHYPVAGAPQTVTMNGTVRIFSHGCESKNVSIEVYTVKRTGGPDDGAPAQLLGAGVTTATDCVAGGVATADSNCGTRYECKYSYSGVPTETELLVKTSGSLWASVYEYNVYLRNTDVQGGAVSRNVRVMASDDYNVLPQAATGGPIAPGNGMILGEVHDCGDVRLSNAVVDIDQPAGVLTYFTPNEESPLPDLAAGATTLLGLYGAMNVAPGGVRVGAVGRAGGALRTIGFTRAQVFADSVSLVTFHGLMPFQTP